MQWTISRQETHWIVSQVRREGNYSGVPRRPTTKWNPENQGPLGEEGEDRQAKEQAGNEKHLVPYGKITECTIDSRVPLETCTHGPLQGSCNLLRKEERRVRQSPCEIIVGPCSLVSKLMLVLQTFSHSRIKILKVRNGVFHSRPV